MSRVTGIRASRSSRGALSRGFGAKPAAWLMALIGACGAGAAVAQDIPETGGDASARWVGQVTPYVWAAGMGGRLTPFTGAPTFQVSKSFGDVLEDSDGAFFLTAYARRDRLVLLGDFTHSRSSKDGRVPPGLPAEGRLRQRSLTLAAGWRIAEDGRAAVDVLGGLRQWSVRSEVQVPLAGVARSPGDTFTDPIVAVRVNAPLSPRWSVIGYADVGGFGVGSEHTHQWLVSANYLHGDAWAFSLGLRALAVDYRDGGTRVDVTLAGPVLGASWRF